MGVSDHQCHDHAGVRGAAVSRVLRVDTRGSARHAVEFRNDDIAFVQSVFDRLRAEQIAIVGVREIRESLEDLFMRLVRDVDGRAKAVGAGNVNTGTAAGAGAGADAKGGR